MIIYNYKLNNHNLLGLLLVKQAKPKSLSLSMIRRDLGFFISKDL